MLTKEDCERKRMPLIRPLCPIHQVPMVVYAHGDGVRYHRCAFYPTCKCTTKTQRK